MHKIIILLSVSLLMQSCFWQKKAWNFNILSPKNNANISQNDTNSITVSGNFYLESANLTRRDKKELKNKFYSLSVEEQNNLREKYNNADSEEKSRFWDWLFGRPTLDGNLYCNGKKGTIRQNGNSGSWYVSGVSLVEGQNTIRCAYSDKNGVKRRSVSVSYNIGSGNQAPIASFTCDTSEVLKLSCDASASTDSDGIISKYIYTVDGIQSETINPIANFEFTEAGIKSVALVVVDNEGERSEEVLKVFNVQDYPSVVANIDSSGGKILLDNYLELNFPTGAFSNETVINAKILTRDIEEPLFKLAEIMIQGEVVAPSFKVNITFPGDQPKTDSNIKIKIPSEFNANELVDKIPVTLIKIQSDIQPEEYFTYNLEENNGFLEGSIPNYYFSKYYDNNDEYWQLELFVIYVDAPAKTLASGPRAEYEGCAGIGMHKPFETTEITSPYGPRTYQGASAFHKGIDFRAKTPTSVMAAFDGEVSAVVDNTIDVPSLGRLVAIKSDKQDGGSIMYAHLSSVNVVKGQIVQAGEIIGISGNSGVNSKGEQHEFHLHAAYSTNAFVHRASKANKIDFKKCVIDPCFTVTDNGYGTASFSALCSKGAISKYEWVTSQKSEVTCEADAEIYVGFGSQSAVLKVTDYWGNVSQFEKSFSMGTPTGDKYIFRPTFVEAELDKNIFSSLLSTYIASPTTGYEPLTVQFNASNSTPNTNEYIHTYRWYEDIFADPIYEHCTPYFEKIFLAGRHKLFLEVEDSNGANDFNDESNGVEIVVNQATGDK